MHMSYELFSEYLEFLCLDKLTSCQKVGQHKRLYDCIPLPHDAIQYRNNEKLATVNSEYKWPTLRKKKKKKRKHTSVYSNTHEDNKWLSTQTKLIQTELDCLSFSSTTLKNLKGLDSLRGDGGGLKVSSPWITADKINANKS